MINPWATLPDSEPFVLPADRVALEVFAGVPEEHRLHLELLPEPFLGRVDAPVVLLNLNPGFDEQDHTWHVRPVYADALRCNLRHEVSAHPFYPLDPALEGAPGYRWWSGKTGPLIRECGRHAVANGLLCVELFPYHSRSFGGHKLRLPSQEYSVALVRQAIARGAFIVVMRAKRHWLERVPELARYADAYPDSAGELPVLFPRRELKFTAALAEEDDNPGHAHLYPPAGATISARKRAGGKLACQATMVAQPTPARKQVP